MLRWMVLTLLISALPAAAATLVCTAEGARVIGTDAARVDLALDGRLYRFRNPAARTKATGAEAAAEAEAQAEADRICAARLGMVAIVLPAPKPSPDEATRGRDAALLKLRALSEALHNPFAEAAQPGRFGGDDLSDLEVGEALGGTEVEAEGAEASDTSEKRARSEARATEAEPTDPSDADPSGADPSDPDPSDPDPDLDAPGESGQDASEGAPHCQASMQASPPGAAMLAALLVLACTRRRRGGR